MLQENSAIKTIAFVSRKKERIKTGYCCTDALEVIMAQALLIDSTRGCC
jgi:hypothetical protein